MNNILLLSKDAFIADYLKIYGGKIWDTPNIDYLIKTGNIFMNYYTAAPSSAMAYSSMFSGLYPFQLDRSNYTEVKPFNICPTLFEILTNKGYECHVIWDEKWFHHSYRFSRVYGDSTIFHNLKINQLVGPHSIKGKRNTFNINANPIEKIMNEVNNILKNSKKPIFLWIHCPHVFEGRTGYGSDIDIFDTLVGKLLKKFPRKGFYLTADHGHMNCNKGIPVYGFHVYEQAIKIPLITPDIFKNKIIFDLVSSIQLKDIIVNNSYKKEKYIYCDSQYYLQENRKLMIRKENYKYIYNKKDASEELYDLYYDPEENVNLLLEQIYDRNRNLYYYFNEIYYYPKMSDISKIYKEFKEEKNRIWKEGTILEKIKYKLYNIIKININYFKFQQFKKTIKCINDVKFLINYYNK